MGLAIAPCPRICERCGVGAVRKEECGGEAGRAGLTSARNTVVEYGTFLLVHNKITKTNPRVSYV